MLTKDKFSWDSPEDAPDTIFEGWHNPAVRWNGFATPAFEKSEADRIMAWQQAHEDAESERITFDVERDSYVIVNPSYPEDPNLYVEGFEADCDVEGIGGKSKRLYAIGSWSWTWMEVGA